MGYIQIALESYKECNDLNSLLLILSSLGMKAELMDLGDLAQKSNQFNVAFMSFYLCNQPNKCIRLLVESNRLAEASIMARSYAPDLLLDLLDKWKAGLKENYPISSQIISDQFDSQELLILIQKSSDINNTPLFNNSL